jgi:hypothetical protein
MEQCRISQTEINPKNFIFLMASHTNVHSYVCTYICGLNLVWTGPVGGNVGRVGEEDHGHAPEQLRVLGLVAAKNLAVPGQADVTFDVGEKGALLGPML